MNTNTPKFQTYFSDTAAKVHEMNKQWWTNIRTGKPLKRNVGELIALMHSELSEGLEAHRKNLKDDKLPQYDGIDVELVDALIRILDLLGHRRVNVDAIFQDKIAYNATRADHKLDARRKKNGKRY